MAIDVTDIDNNVIRQLQHYKAQSNRRVERIVMGGQPAFEGGKAGCLMRYEQRSLMGGEG